MALGPVRYDKQALEGLEESRLAFYAVKSTDACRIHPVPADSGPVFRMAFQRDRDRIIHSRSFRRLKQKTQVFVPDEGDHFRTRLSHTLEVSQLGRSVARSLALNEDLVEAITLAHDLGHAPFGHSGEEILHRIMSGGDSLEGELESGPQASGIPWEGFKHNHQSLRIVDLLESKYPQPGLNLTHYVREGILRHTDIQAKTGIRAIQYNDLDYGSLCLDMAPFLEAQVVALVDEVAQHTHDLEDGFRAHVVSTEAMAEKVAVCRNWLEERKEQGVRPVKRDELIHHLINYFIRDLQENSFENLRQWARSLPQQDFGREHIRPQLIGFSRQGQRDFDELAEFVIAQVIHCQEVDRMDARAAVILPQLFKAYLRNPRLLPDYLLGKFCESEGIPPLRVMAAEEMEKTVAKMKNNIRYLRSVCDYIAGMTDVFAIKEFQMTVNPSPNRS